MKALIAGLVLIAATFAAHNAQAEVKPKGSFIPTQCGEQQYDGNPTSIDVEAICVGTIAGDLFNAHASAVDFRLTDGSSKVFKVIDVQSYLMALLDGNVKSLFQLQSDDGEVLNMKVLQSKDGSVNQVSGDMSGIMYYVPKFEPIFVTM